uniref:Minor capsid protein P8 central region domain-containing protein n=1 Tax=viral metagenome TaxID=1070528 RepID=A0A6C0KJ91_9ZZZZ
MNGRVDIMNKSCAPFFLSDKIPVNDKMSSYKDALTGNWNNTILSQTFFSKDNIIILQNAIRKRVYNQTNKLISNQNEDTLKIIMRSTFLQFSANLPKNIKEQINALNNKVLSYCVPKVLSELTSYIKYAKDVSTMAMPIDRPAYISTKGTKTLELEPWF